MTDRRWWTDDGDGKLYLSGEAPPPLPVEPMDVPNFRCVIAPVLVRVVTHDANLCIACMKVHDECSCTEGSDHRAKWRSVMGPSPAASVEQHADPLEAMKADERSSAKPGEWCDVHDDWQANCGQDAEACWQDEQDAQRERDEERRWEGGGW